MYYFGITLGPVVHTILQARKTRELWVASFVFSLCMKNLLLGLRGYGKVLAPDITNIDSQIKLHGAGIWPDRCFLQIEAEKDVERLKSALLEVIEQALSLINGKLGGEYLPFLKNYFHCYAVGFQEGKHDFKPQTEREEKLQATHILRLNKMLDDLELAPKFIQEGDDDLLVKLVEKIKAFYDEGFAEKDEALHDYGNQPGRRVRSLPEIATREFSKRNFYKSEVEVVIDEAIKEFQRNGKKESEAEEAIFKNLKKTLGDELLGRHRYVAIVQADGDGIGKTIASLENDATRIQDFSKELMAFAESAVRKIVAFGAMPVYAGGDDLLFIAPLQNHAETSIYALLKDLREDFCGRAIFKNNGATLSFGVSISYYKYPLSEALEAAHDLLKYSAKTLCIKKDEYEKDALAIRLLTHSGQAFETLLWQQGKSFTDWLGLMKDSQKLDEAFIAGLMHKIDLLALWLFDACQRDTLDAFFEAHFNEARHTDKWKFVEKVRDLAHQLFSDYLLADAEMGEDKKQLGLRLHAMLRLIQFQNAPDHE